MRVLLLMALLSGTAWAQPYIDLAAVRFSRGFDAGLLRRGYVANKFQYGHVQVQVPLTFKKDSSILLLNPIAERWQPALDITHSLPASLDGIGLFAAYIKPWSPKWTTTFALIPRWNGSGVSGSDRFQLGGLLLATHNRKPGPKYKMGVYFNREFFGNFVVPVLGIEYKINRRLQLYGNLPGSLTLERKANPHFYYGVSFRAITNSYRFPGTAGGTLRFIRIDENQLQGFADYYLTRNLVVTTELGHSLLRRFRIGEEGGNPKYTVKEPFNDGIVARVALAYRIRLDQ